MYKLETVSYYIRINSSRQHNYYTANNLMTCMMYTDDTTNSTQCNYVMRNDQQVMSLMTTGKSHHCLHQLAANSDDIV